MARFLTRVRLENYKSIAYCDVELQDLTFLVGPNGAGKSNFLDSLFVIFSILEIENSNEIMERGIRNIKTANERIKQNENNNKCVVSIGKSNITFEMFREKNCVLAGDYRDIKIENIFRLYKFLPGGFTEPVEVADESILEDNGKNLSGILYNLQEKDRVVYGRINSYIRKISSEVERVWVLRAGGYDILQFSCYGSDIPFNASQMSDGTLHALGVLTAIFHAKSAGIPLIGIEEPEAGLHPAAARVLYDALAEASQDVQIIVTSHSPDLLDNPDVSPDNILAVVRQNSETKIGPVDDASRQVLNEHMFTAGELLRLNQLIPKQ